MRLIEADAAKVALTGWETDPTDEEIEYAIDNIPTVDAVEVVHGRWVDRYGGKYANPVYDCSECKNAALGKLKTDELGTSRFVQELSAVCPNCGARMDGDEND